MKSEPVIILAIAKVCAAAIVGLGARYGLHLDDAELVALIVGVEGAFAAWTRSQVWSYASVAKLAIPGAVAHITIPPKDAA